MENPLIICTLSGQRAKTALESQGCELLSVDSAEQMLTTEFPRAPRLFVMQVEAGDLEEVQRAIPALRNQWPLTDVLIWAPGVESELVRTLFQAGVRDVILSPSEEVLQQVVAETLESEVSPPDARLESSA